jgi:DNA-binding cell septation regulator SpoVG
MGIQVNLRHSTKPDSKIVAHADVVLSLADGKIQLNSFCIFKLNGKPAWVAPPATKGEKRFFPLIVLSGEIRKHIEQAILAEYERQTGASS